MHWLSSEKSRTSTARRKYSAVTRSARFRRSDVDTVPIPGPTSDAFHVGHVVNMVPEDGIFHG